MNSSSTLPLVSVPSSHVNVLNELGWTTPRTITLAARPGEWVFPDTNGLAPETLKLAQSNPRGIYRHQEEALTEARVGHDVAVTTSTGSGKSLIFQLSVINKLATDKHARALVLFPLRALAEEQFDRWTKAIQRSGLDASVSLLIGGTSGHAQRLKDISKARVVISTPDLVHAWMMQHRNSERAVGSFMKHLRIVVIDEAHAYTAVFGSQSAFLFRRLDHAVRRASGQAFQILAASATMAEPEKHLRALTGRNMRIIGVDRDTSPSFEKRIHFVQPAQGADLISGLGRWFRHCADHKLGKFLAFVESRVQAEHFARGAGRRTANDASVEVDTETAIEQHSGGSVRAFRAGFENQLRRDLLDGLRDGQNSGLVTTSALELGIDLPDLSLGFIIGCPRSATSLFQRLGRFGRHAPCDIFIINDGSPAADQLTSNPDGLLQLPLQSSTLYLNNPRIQYIHTLCQAREDGWADMDTPPESFESDVDFPSGFLELCRKELHGESVGDLRGLRPAGDEAAHLVYPLRDCDLQFVVKLSHRGLVEKLGTLTFGQVLREAYPGAVYWHAGRAYRVVTVQVNRHVVMVQPSSGFFTKPKVLPSVLQPDLSSDGLLSWSRFDNLSLMECQLQARECVAGFQERRGSNSQAIDYPLQRDNPSGTEYVYPRFCRHIETTGVVLHHVSFNNPQVRLSEIADTLLEAFLQTVPIERQDIAVGTGTVRVNRNEIARGDRFISVYDRTYGSLRLSGFMRDELTLRNTLDRAILLAQSGLVSDRVTLDALEALCRSTKVQAVDVAITETVDSAPANDSAAGRIRVIRPGSRGVHREHGAAFEVISVFYAPDGLRYRGKFDHQRAEETPGSIPASSILELPGESEVSWFDPVIGEIVA